MNFEDVQTAIITTIGNGASGNFRVCGYHNKPEDVANIKNTNASVSVFFSRARIPRGKSALQGPWQWDVTYNIELSISTPASADIATLNDEGSTQGERATALSNITNTRQLSNIALNSLIKYVYTIIHNPSNLDFGLTVGKIRNRWVDDIETNEDPIFSGDYLVSEATMHLSLTLSENTTDDVLDDLEIIDTTLKLNDEPGPDEDTEGRAGVINDYTE